MEYSRLSVQILMEAKADKVWESIKESTTVFPKASPDLYESIQLLQGDGKTIGSARIITYTPGLSVITTTTEKIEDLEEENKAVSYCVIDGDLLKYYHKFKCIIRVLPRGDGSTVQWCCEFAKASEFVPDQDEFVPDQELFRDFAVKNFRDLDAYILAGNI